MTGKHIYLWLKARLAGSSRQGDGTGGQGQVCQTGGLGDRQGQPANPGEVFDILASLPDDFMAGGRQDPPPGDKEDF